MKLIPNLMITALSPLGRNSPGMIRRMNKNSKQVCAIRMKNIGDIKGVPSKHPFR